MRLFQNKKELVIAAAVVLSASFLLAYSNNAQAISCQRCSETRPCQYATWESGGSSIACDSAQDQKLDVVYTANDSCASLCLSPNVCYLGSCVSLKSCGRCSYTQPCRYASWQVPVGRDCESAPKYNEVNTVNSSCAALCQSGYCGAGGACYIQPQLSNCTLSVSPTETCSNGTWTWTGASNPSGYATKRYGTRDGVQDIFGDAWFGSTNFTKTSGLNTDDPGVAGTHVIRWFRIFDPITGAELCTSNQATLVVRDCLPPADATVSWSPVPGATYYNLRINDPTNDSPSCTDGWYCSDPPDKLIDNYTSTSYTFPALRGGYSWWVQACNASGCSASSLTSFTCSGPVCNSYSYLSGSISPASPANVNTGGSYTMRCDYGQAGIDCINVQAPSGSCSFSGWSGRAATFSCTAGSVTGTLTGYCQTIVGTGSNCCSNTNSAGDLVVSLPKYKCSGASCVRNDASGNYTTSNCDNACAIPTALDFYPLSSNNIYATVPKGASGDSTETTITIVPLNSFSSNISLSVVSSDPALPLDTTYLFSRPDFSSPLYSSGSTFKVHLGSGLQTSQTYSIVIKATGGGLTRTTTILLNANIKNPAFIEF